MLPKISNYLNYRDITLPFSNIAIKMRPFTFGEEKEYLVAIGNKKDERIFYEKTKMLIANCLAEESKAVLQDISKYDFKYLCKELRRVSKGSKIELSREKCQNKECGARFDSVVLDLNTDYTVKVRATDEIKINDNLSIFIKDISLAKEQSLAEKYTGATVNIEDTNKFEVFYDFLIASVSKVVYEGEVYEDFTEEEVSEFLDNLAVDENVDIIESYVKSLNSMEISKKVKCPMCEQETTITIDSLSFFLI